MFAKLRARSGFATLSRRVLRLVVCRHRAGSAATPPFFRVEEADLDAALAGFPLVESANLKPRLRAYLETAGLVNTEGTLTPRGHARAEAGFVSRHPLLCGALLLTSFFVLHLAFELWYTERLVRESQVYSESPYEGDACPDDGEPYEDEGGVSPIGAGA